MIAKGQIKIKARYLEAYIKVVDKNETNSKDHIQYEDALRYKGFCIKLC